MSTGIHFQMTPVSSATYTALASNRSPQWASWGP
jgi:hypothetical protein